MAIDAILIDSREPAWVQRLTFGGVPTSVMMMDAGDLTAVCDDGSMLSIERKTPDDFLNTLRDERLFPQLTRLVEPRINEQINNNMTTWPYLVITGELSRSPKGKVVTSDRGETGWDWAAVQGALLTVQEMGVFVAHCGGDGDYEACVVRLSNRCRDKEFKLLPPRPPQIVGASANFLAGLPGIGVERVLDLLKWAGSPAHALIGITDLEVDVPGIPMGVRKKIRSMLGLKDFQHLDVWSNTNLDETMIVMEQK